MTAPADTLDVEAQAKINVYLRVLGRREDGFHHLDSLVVPLTLSDGLHVHAAADPTFRTLALSLEVRAPKRLLAGIPVDESNLVLRAAHALAEATGVRGFADFVLHKRIPAAGGLGGGSSDAAAALRALNALWGCGLDDRALGAVAATVGSDVPALLGGRPVRVTGRGELVEAAEAAPLRWALVPQRFGVSTAEAFGWWDEDGAPSTPDGDRRITAILRGAARGDVAVLGPVLFNDLEGPVLRRHPQLAETKERLLEAGAAGAVLCGSGSTVAGLLPLDLPFEEVTRVVPGAVAAASG